MNKEETAQILISSFRDTEKTLHRTMYRKLVPSLSPSQVFILMRLMRLQCQTLRTGKQDGGLRVSELAAYLGVSVPGMTQLVTGLEKSGFVRREADPEDRRAVRVFLTESGKQFMEPAYAYLVELFTGLSDHLGPEDTKKLMELLERSNMYFTEAGLS